MNTVPTYPLLNTPELSIFACFEEYLLVVAPPFFFLRFVREEKKVRCRILLSMESCYDNVLAISYASPPPVVIPIKISALGIDPKNNKLDCLSMVSILSLVSCLCI